MALAGEVPIFRAIEPRCLKLINGWFLVKGCFLSWKNDLGVE